MLSARDHFNLFKEGIHRAKLIREDLKLSLIEQDLKKIKGLNKSYVDMLKETIRQGEYYLDKSNDFKLGLKVAITIENYRAFLSALSKKNKDDRDK
tara:strand:+ start:1252 stop:1539 length:288 start_codon:yes stop_codon:yes gene_type:complete